MPRRPLLARLLGGLLPAALAGACDDGWRPEEVVRLPPGQVEGATEPRRWALAEATERLLDRPGRLLGQPAEAAFAAGLVEYLATAFQDGQFPDGRHVTRLLREGRAPLRAAIGLRDDAAPQVVADALLAAVAAGRRGDSAAAARTLTPFARRAELRSPWTALAALDPPGPLRRALRAARDMLLESSFPR